MNFKEDKLTTFAQAQLSVYTSYFANWRHFPQGYQGISIALYSPKGWTRASLKELSPSAALLAAYKNKAIDEIEYEKIYLNQLIDRGLTPQSIVERIPNNSILLCYEKKGEFCHRHILANWLNSNCDIDIQEL